MKKMILITFIMTVFFAIALIVTCNRVLNEVDKTNRSLIDKVGERVIIEKDTVMIIDYSLINNTFTLKDGRKINVDLVKKLQTIK